MNKFRLKIVKVNPDYCDYLRLFDNKVAYNKDIKEQRPYVGILFTIDNKEYFSPLSSPKEKHKKMRNNIDFYKIDDGKLGVINFNNMIPVKKGNYTLVDLDGKFLKGAEEQYIFLLRKQLFWLNDKVYIIKRRAKRLYDLYNNKKLPKSILNRCCNFKLLEEKCDLYKK